MSGSIGNEGQNGMNQLCVPSSGETEMDMLTLNADEWHALKELALRERTVESIGWARRNFNKEADANRIGTVRWLMGNESHYLIDGWTDDELKSQAEDHERAERRKAREEAIKARTYPPWPEDPENRYLRAGRNEADARMIRVRLWRSSLTGCANVAKSEIEVPKPLTRKSLYIFLHEIGHVAIGHLGKKKRHVEEYEAEQFAHERMRELGFAVPRSQTERAKAYVARKIGQAYARGAKRIDPKARRFAEGRRR